MPGWHGAGIPFVMLMQMISSGAMAAAISLRSRGGARRRGGVTTPMPSCFLRSSSRSCLRDIFRGDASFDRRSTQRAGGNCGELVAARVYSNVVLPERAAVGNEWARQRHPRNRQHVVPALVIGGSGVVGCAPFVPCPDLRLAPFRRLE